MNYYYSIDGTEVLGPNSLAEINKFFEVGILPSSTQVCLEGQETWQPLSTIISPPRQPIAAKTVPPSEPNRATSRPVAVPQKQTNPLGAVFTLVFVGVGAWYYFGGGLEHQAQRDMGHIEQQVAIDAVRQYEIAKRSGNAMDAYVHAGLVAAAYLQAKDEANYQTWKGIEAEEGRRAGMPSQ